MTTAVRSDLADIRLAERIFAPHYAAPRPMILTRSASLRADRSQDASILATLYPGDSFELLDLAGGSAWGTAPGPGLVGYIDAAALGRS